MRQITLQIIRKVKFCINSIMQQDILFPREAGRFIAEHSKDVSLVDSGIKKVAQMIHKVAQRNDIGIHVDRWKIHDLNPKTADQAAIDWVFFSDTLNFSFWSDDESRKCKINYGGKEWTGYWCLCAAMNRAIDEGIPITDPNYYAKVTKEELVHILRSDTPYEIPMLDERVQNLHQAGKKLVDKYDGTFINVLKACNNSAQKLLKIVVEEFPSYRDEADFQSTRVAIYKRVQILIGDIWACCGGKGLGTFNDIDSITMFADYRIPQALVYFGALKYSDELMNKLKKNSMLDNGSREEVEIRGCTIEVVERICEEARKLIAADPSLAGMNINAILIDHYLWDFRREHAKDTEHIPIHKTRCIYY